MPRTSPRKSSEPPFLRSGWLRRRAGRAQYGPPLTLATPPGPARHLDRSGVRRRRVGGAWGTRRAKRCAAPGQEDPGNAPGSVSADTRAPLPRGMFDQRGGQCHGRHRCQRQGFATPGVSNGCKGGRGGAGMTRQRRITAYLDALAAGRRPGAMRAEPEDVELLRTAIALRAARPGDATPDQDFVSGLYRELAANAAAAVVPIDRPTKRHRARV